MSTISVLVVEDNLLVQKVVKRFLEAENFTADLVKTGLEALKKFKTQHYQLVIMDIGLPDINGCETALLMKLYEHKKRREFTPIVGLTASTAWEDHREALFSGINPVFIKPLDNDSKQEILKIIKSASKNPKSSHKHKFKN